MINNIFTRVIVSGLAIALTAFLLPGISITSHDPKTYVFLAVIVGIVNGFIRPIINVLTFPINFLTLGLFHLVINAGLLYLVAYSTTQISGIGQLQIANPLWAIAGGLVLAIFNSVLEGIAKNIEGDSKRKSQQREMENRVRREQEMRYDGR